MLHIEKVPLNCTNTHCTNRSSEGGFARVNLGGVTVWVCVPCAEEIRKEWQSDYISKVAV